MALIKDLYKQAIAEMLENGEMDKVEKYATDQKDSIKVFRKNIEVLTSEKKKVTDIPIIPLVVTNNSAELWKDIFCVMMAIESRETAKGENAMD